MRKINFALLLKYYFVVLAEDGALAEIGPRFVMNPVKIFADSFCGEALWENSDYVTPAKHRRMLRTSAKDKYLNRTETKARYEATQPKEAFNLDKFGREAFSANEEEMAEKIVAQENEEEMLSESDDSEKIEKQEQQNIERVKKLIEKLKPGRDGKKLVRQKKYIKPSANGKILKKPANKKSKMIQNIIKTRKLSTKKSK